MDIIPTPPPTQAIRDTPLSEPAGPYKVNRQLREIFREAFDNLGGAEWLVEFATSSDANARVFVQAISKLLPASASPTANEKTVVEISWLTKDRLAYKNVPVDEEVVEAEIYEMPRPKGLQ